MEQIMTAEVAVMNKSAIALAADSKVTISGMGGSKTYDTVSKVFTLSKIHPVGIMIFGNAEFMAYPWETIIKLYRKEKGEESEVTIEAWGVDFTRYLRGFGKIRKAHRTENAQNIMHSWLQRANDEAIARAQTKNITIPSPEFIGILKERVNAIFETFGEAPLYFSKEQASRITGSYLKDALSVADKLFRKH